MKVGHILAILLLCVSFATVLSLTPTVVCDPPMKINFTQTGVGADFTGNVLTVDGGTNYQVATLPRVYNWQVNDTHSFAWLSPLAASADKRYLWVSTSGLSTLQSDTITVTVDGTVAASYKTQYYVSVSATAVGSVDVSTGWYDGSGSVPVAATPNSGYLFKNWAVTGSVSVADPNSASTTMTVSGAGTLQAVFESQTTWAIDFNLAGVGSDFSGNVLTLDAGSYGRASFNFSLNLTEGSVHPFSWLSPLAVSSDKQYVWASTGGLSTLQSGSITVPSGTGSLTGSYKTQYYVALTASAGGTINASGAWHDDLSVFYVTASPGTGYSFKNWTATGGASVSDPNNPAATITVTGGGSVLANFDPLPFNVSFSQSGVGTDFSGTVVNVDGSGVLRSELTKTYTWLYGSGHSFSWLSPLAVSADKQYVWVSTAGLSTAQGASVTITATGSVDATYKTQFYITLTAGAGGVVNRASGWYDASSPIPISATPNAGYGFKNWTVTGGVSVADPSSPTTTMTVNGAGALQAYFELLPVGISFMQSGIGTDYSGVVLNVDGEMLIRANLTKTYNWSIGSSHAFSWLAPLSVSSDKRYVWISTTGLSTAQSGAITVPNGTGYVAANYVAQHYVNITSGAGGTVNASNGWRDAFSTVTITATPGVGYNFKSWTVSGSVSVSDASSPTTILTVAGAGSVQATFEIMILGVSFVQSGVGTDFSGIVVNIDGFPVTRSELVKVYNWSYGSGHSFSWLSPLAVSSSEQYVWTSTSGLSTLQADSIVVTSAGSVTGSYKAQYYLTITAGIGGTVNASSGWHDGSGRLYVAAAPGLTYGFKGWLTTGNISVADPYNPTTTVTVNGAGSLQATFELLPVGISFTQYGIGTDFSGGVVDVDGTVLLRSDLTKTYSWSIGSMHAFSWLSPLDVSSQKRYVWDSTYGLSTLQNGSIATPSGSGAVAGSYYTEYFVTVEGSEGGTADLPAGDWYRADQAVSVSATPSGSYRFSNWTTTGGVDVADPTASSTTFTASGPGGLRANFVYTPPGINVTFQSSFGGSTRPSGSGSYQQGELVVITATPENGYRFSAWEVVGGSTVLDPASSSTTLTVNGPATVRANFIAVFNVTFQASAGGSTTPSGYGSYLDGTSITIAAVPAEGWRFLGWNVTGNAMAEDPTSATTTLTINGHAVVIARFRQGDSSPPIVTDLYPADGAIMSNGSFTISASFSDDTAIDPSSVVLKVDGSEVSGAQISESGVSYVASLGAGTHRVELTVMDTEGNPRTVTWSIVAAEGPQPVPWELWAVIGVEVVTAGLIGYYWWTRKKPAALPKVDKKPVAH